ncbi:MAG: hypothetical protein JO301_09205 [Chitinophagaceae bacterium]|nr:hypothetical protein [Chitinophagaceae bacterium]
MNATAWPAWRRISFRFLFILIALITIPWWLSLIPGFSWPAEIWSSLEEKPVTWLNAHFLHIKAELVPPNGSGDTSYGWAQLDFQLLAAFFGCIVWSLLDRKRLSYERLNYWLVLFARYFVAMVAFVYGVEKLFALQMTQPNLSQLATPLGDLLPMRLSWMFIGYSTPYQVFSGAMEVIAGLLLCWRRTATLGALVSLAVFFNVMMLNLSYDIPVKIFSMQMVFVCLFLVGSEMERIICFFVLNKPAAACTVYHFSYRRKWMRVTRIILKIFFLITAFGMQFYNNAEYYKYIHGGLPVKPIQPGLYDVAVYVKGNDTIPIIAGDSLRWRDIVFDVGGAGSVKSADTVFRQRYHRGYFSYAADTTAHMLSFKRFQTDSLAKFSLSYELPDEQTIRLRGTFHDQPLYVELRKSRHRFQLAEHQFHWLSEANR